MELDLEIKTGQVWIDKDERRAPEGSTIRPVIVEQVGFDHVVVFPLDPKTFITRTDGRRTKVKLENFLSRFRPEIPAIVRPDRRCEDLARKLLRGHLHSEGDGLYGVLNFRSTVPQQVFERFRHSGIMVKSSSCLSSPDSRGTPC